MSEVIETPLPGVGVRYDFLTAAGSRIGVLAHHLGHRELLIYDRADPDASRSVLGLAPDDARTLADLLGAPHLSGRLGDVEQRIAGLAIDWIALDAQSPLVGRSLRETAVHSRTGVSIVAVLRGDDEAFPAPTGDFVLEAGDVAVAVGLPRGVAELRALRTGP